MTKEIEELTDMNHPDIPVNNMLLYIDSRLHALIDMQLQHIAKMENKDIKAVKEEFSKLSAKHEIEIRKSYFSSKPK